jgi:hypothetical protein
MEQIYQTKIELEFQKKLIKPLKHPLELLPRDEMKEAIINMTPKELKSLRMEGKKYDKRIIAIKGKIKETKSEFLFQRYESEIYNCFYENLLIPKNEILKSISEKKVIWNGQCYLEIDINCIIVSDDFYKNLKPNDRKFEGAESEFEINSFNTDDNYNDQLDLDQQSPEYWDKL